MSLSQQQQRGALANKSQLHQICTRVCLRDARRQRHNQIGYFGETIFTARGHTTGQRGRHHAQFDRRSLDMSISDAMRVTSLMALRLCVCVCVQKGYLRNWVLYFIGDLRWWIMVCLNNGQ